MKSNVMVFAEGNLFSIDCGHLSCEEVKLALLLLYISDLSYVVHFYLFRAAAQDATSVQVGFGKLCVSHLV